MSKGKTKNHWKFHMTNCVNGFYFAIKYKDAYTKNQCYKGWYICWLKQCLTFYPKQNSKFLIYVSIQLKKDPWNKYTWMYSIHMNLPQWENL